MMNNRPVVCEICRENNHSRWAHTTIFGNGLHSRAEEKACCYCALDGHVCYEHDAVHWIEQYCCNCGDGEHICQDHYDEEEEEEEEEPISYHAPVYDKKYFIAAYHVSCDCLTE